MTEALSSSAKIVAFSGVALRRLDPEFAEIGEFLVVAAGVDGKAARGKPVALAAAEEAEIGGAEEGHQLVLARAGEFSG